MTILSLDWDYYVAATMSERISMFPDGGTENLEKELEVLIWMSCYADSIANKKYRNPNAKLLADIQVDEKSISDTLSVLSAYRKSDTDLIVRASHKDIVEVVPETSDVTVINVDFHHDCYNFGNVDYDSGNWGALLLKQKKIKSLHWVKREDSDTENIKTNIQIHIGLNNIRRLLETGIDVIFLCMSPVWTPPHLDADFVVFANQISSITGNDANLDIQERRTEDIQNSAGQLAKAMESYFRKSVLQ